MLPCYQLAFSFYDISKRYLEGRLKAYPHLCTLLYLLKAKLQSSMEDEYSKYLLTAISIRFQSSAIAKHHKKVGIILNETLLKKSGTVLSWLVAVSEKVLGFHKFVMVIVVDYLK